MGILKNGTSVYDIKDWMVSTISPKYFDEVKNLTELNVGLYGYITEILSNTVKDGYFAIGSLFKEMFPTCAEIPKSIYDHAILFQLSNVFANASKVPFTILLSEEAVINASEVDSDFLYFDIDSGAEFSINNLTFMLDYDVRVFSKKTTTGYIHSAQYKMDKTNVISDLNNPFIRTSIYLNENKKRYILLEVKLHQVSKKTISDTIISNDKINVVTLQYTFSGQLANFDIFYKSPTDRSYTQLKKLLANTNKVTDPFCFYQLIDDNKLQIDFSNDDRFFIPEYGSDVVVELYTTEGSNGNFDVYEGSDVKVVGKSDKYPSNKGIIFMGTVTGAATGGSDRKSIEELREDTIKAWATYKSFTTTNDLNLYFDQITSSLKTKIIFMKKRDDAFERLYSAFILFKNADGDVIPTNTLDTRIYTKDISTYIEQTHRSVIPAGKLYKYITDTSGTYAIAVDDLKYTDDLDEYEKDDSFLYVNPFLTIVCTNPLNVGFYLNSINSSLEMTHREINSSSFLQFLVNTLEIKRDALAGEDEYTLTTRLGPSTYLDKQAFTLIRTDTRVKDTDRVFTNKYKEGEWNYIDNGNLRVVLEFLDKKDQRKFYVMMYLVGFDDEDYIFQAKIKTNDYISTNQEFQIISGHRSKDDFSENPDPELIPVKNCHINLYTLYQFPDTTTKQNHKFSNFKELELFTLTNMYSLAEDTPAVFIQPVKEIRSYIEYAMKESNGRYGFRLESIPYVKANYLKMDGVKDAFFDSFNYIYDYIQSALNLLTNNFSIDIKFFNTYGYSNHYYIVDGSNTHIDRINISIYFDVRYNITSNTDSLTQQIKEYIKEYIETEQISLVSSPSFYVSNLISACKEKFSGLKFMIFKGINSYGPDIQALESDVNESNIIQGIVKTSDVIPEYLNIDQKISGTSRTPQIFINVLS